MTSHLTWLSAILTKYETLRSFVKLKPAAFSPMGYEVAQMYTNNLLDVFMDYKNVCDCSCP